MQIQFECPRCRTRGLTPDVTAGTALALCFGSLSFPCPNCSTPVSILTPILQAIAGAQRQTPEETASRSATIQEALAAHMRNLENQTTPACDREGDLGAAIALYEAGKYDEAFKLLQTCQRDPRQRRTAGRYLGLCLHAKGLDDLAIETFRSALENGTDTR